MRLGRQTIVVEEYPPQRRGVVPDFTLPPAKSVVVRGCSVQPGTSGRAAGRRILDGRDNMTVHWTLFAPVTAPLTEHSVVNYQGRRYALDGKPLVWEEAGESYIQAYLIDWIG